MIILVRKLQLFIIAFDEFFVYPQLIGGPYATIKDLVSLGVVLAISYAFYRRLVKKPARLELHTEGLVILSLIMTIMLTDFSV